MTVLQALTILLAIVRVSFAMIDERDAISDDIYLSEAYGGPHGNAFSDISSITLGETLRSVALRGHQRVVSVSTQVESPLGLAWDHGGGAGQETVLLLNPDEYINKVEIYWGRTKTNTHVNFVKLSTNCGNYAWAGTNTSNSAILTAPEGFQLSGFFGRASDEIYQLGMIWTRRSAKAEKLTDVMDTDWYGDRIRNWVGPTIGHAKDSACYRLTKPFDSNKGCPEGYNSDNGRCIAQCPLAYPVTCFVECIPQNDLCAYEIMQKGAAVLATVVNMATAGAIGVFARMSDKTKSLFFCAANIVGVMRSLIYYMRFHQTTAPRGTIDELLAIAYQSDVVLVDLPVAINHCLGHPVSKSLVTTGVVMMVVESIVRQTLMHGEEILSSANNVYRLIENATDVNITAKSVDELQDFLDSNSTCGYQLKRLTDKVIISVNKVRGDHSDATINDIRTIISRSSLVFTDIPVATNNCLNEMLAYKTRESAFKTRDLLRKTFSVIVDQLVEKAATNMGAFVAEEDYLLETLNLGLVTFAGLDPTRIMWMASQFVQPVCGPTAFIGDIDDGSLYDALGLTTVDEAFVGSYGSWKKKGDGVVDLIITNMDTEDMKVAIHSGGKSIAKVPVDTGATVVWSCTIVELQEKTLYLNQHRTYFFGLPKISGGSLKLWVPKSSEGGHLTLYVQINHS